MVRYGSREVLQILAIRPHVLRYWEQLLPLVRAERDETGHRVWTEAQVRILQRLAHLVNDRGMAVQAAGDAILREAESGAGNVKGILEAVRHELMTVLHRIRRNEENDAARSGRSSAPTESEDLRRTVALPGSAPPSPLSRWDPVEQGGVPRPGGAPRSDSGVQARLERRHRLSPSESGTAPHTLEVVRIAYRHLFAYTAGARGETREIPRILAEIIRTRFASVPDKSAGEATVSRSETTVVCAPADEIDRYRAVFAEGNGPVPTVLPVPYLSYEGARWISPLLSLLIALRDDPLWREVAGPEVAGPEAAGNNVSASVTGRYGYLWAPENPDVPVDLPVTPFGSATARPVLTVHPGQRGTLLGEGLVVPLGNRALLDDLIRRGRWSLGRVLDCNGKDADTFPVRWRYDLLLRDLVVPGTPWIVLPRSDRPSLWRGDDWRRQMSAVWPELDVRERWGTE